MPYSDKEKQKEAQNTHYLQNKPEFQKRSKSAKESKMRFVNAVKSYPCEDCETYWPPCAMHLDHRNPSEKIMGVSDMVKKAGWSRMVEEIMKCDLVCACCHALRTFHC